MAERPILFDAESMRAFLADEKTETRRPMDPQPLRDIISAEVWVDGLWRIEHEPASAPVGEYVGMRVECPYGRPGDRLWVREAWRLDQILGWPSYRKIGRYLADGAQWAVRMDRDLQVMHNVGKKPSIFMPREVSRLDCELLGVKAQRIQSMTPEEITAEGIPLANFEADNVLPETAKALQLDAWIARWNGINADRGYPHEDNPWVWALALKPQFGRDGE